MSQDPTISLARRHLASLLILLCLATGCDTLTDRSTDPARLVDQPPPDSAALVSTIDEVLDYTKHKRFLRSDQHAAWQIMHGVLAFGPTFEIEHEAQRVQALQWVLDGGNMNGWTMRPGNVGLKAVVEVGSKTGQGHEDQWLAVIAQTGLPTDHPIRVGNDRFTIGDLVEQAKHDVYDGKECSWTLIGLSAYLAPETTWTARDGSEWSIERMMAMEADQDLVESACGGTHRLIGMTMALEAMKGRQTGESAPGELSGGWEAARQRIEQAIETAKEYQQASGAFSVNYFERPANSPDLAAHLGATGHTLEFLSLALPQDRLAEAWVERAVAHLCEVLDKTRHLDLECGALYHAVHGLVLYRERRFGPRD